MNSPIKNLTHCFEEENIDAFLVMKDVNIRYLTGFPASESWLLVAPKKTFYITDFRYVLEAQKGLKGIPVRKYTASIFETLFELVQALGIKRLGLDDRHISLFEFHKLKKYCPAGCKLFPRRDLVENLRQIKTREEIRQIRAAITLNHKAYRFLGTVVRPGLTEEDVLQKLENFVRSHQAGFSFDPIIASGPNSCFPHARVSSRKLRNNEPVLIDMGIDLKGYKSDLTRMFFLGKIPQLVNDVNAIVKASQQKAIAKIKPGILAREVDHEARNYLAQHRLDKFFGHSLGHGVGLEIHEGPRISQASGVVLKAGMVFTVEPAVYLPHRFGIRIEDMVLVTPNGCEVMSDNIHQ